jgi:hypothetical protein
MQLIQLTQNQQTQVSDEDFEFVSQWKWLAVRSNYGTRARTRWYASRTSKTIKMHKVIYENMTGELIPEGYIVDHIDRDTLNNQRTNLRLVTHQQNLFNRSKRRLHMGGEPTKLPYIGVIRESQAVSKPYRAQIYSPKFEILGWFATPEEAARAYDIRCLELRGEFASLNFPVEV